MIKGRYTLGYHVKYGFINMGGAYALTGSPFHPWSNFFFLFVYDIFECCAMPYI